MLAAMRDIGEEAGGNSKKAGLSVRNTNPGTQYFEPSHTKL
jgi:hypothetical protein